MRRRLALLLLLPVALVVGVTVGYTKLRSDSPSESPTAAEAARQVPLEGSLPATGMVPIDQQVAFWQRRVDENPTDYLSLTQLGSALVAQAKTNGDLDRYRDAEMAFRDALDLNPRYASALLGMGSTRAAEHDFASALDLANDVLSRTPDNLNAVAAAGDSNLELGNYDEAREFYARLADEGRSAPIVSRLARLAWLSGDTDEAVELAAEAASRGADLDLPPAQEAFYDFQEATYLYGAGRIDEAEEVTRDGLALSPTDPALSELLPKILVAQGELDEAIERYEALIANTPTPAADLNGELAKLYDAVGRHADADEQVQLGLDAARVAIDRYPAERRHLASFLIDQDPALALELAREDAASRHDVASYDILAWSLYGNGQYGEAADAIHSALAQGTQDAVFLYHAGMIAAATGEADEARRFLERSLEINPRFDVVGAAEASETLEGLD